MSQPPGTGGLIPPPVNAPAGQPTPVGVQPGSSSPVVRARQIIVFGPGEGVFVYSGTPALGNPPIAAMTGSTADPYGNPVKPEISSISGGQAAWLFGAVLNFVATAAQFQAATVYALASGELGLSSGLQTNTDIAANVQVVSQQASGAGTAQIGLLAGQLYGAINTPQAAVSGFPLPNDTNSGTGWVSGERAFMNNSWIAPINALYNALVSAGIIT